MMILILISIVILYFEQHNRLNAEKRKYSKLLSQKKSGEVVLGQITEQLAPFLDTFPIQNPQDLVFLGMPLDYVHFGEEKITFIEIKSGKSKLSTKQRRLRNLIRDGKIEFLIHQVPEK